MSLGWSRGGQICVNMLKNCSVVDHGHGVLVEISESATSAFTVYELHNVAML